MPRRLTPIMRATTVLVVDDDAQVRRLVRDALLSLDATAAHGPETTLRIIEAATAADAVALAASELPALVVLDLLLPDGDGRDVLTEMRAFSDAPVLVLSVLSDEATKARIIDGGADDYVSKPFSQIELRARFGALFRRVAGPGTTSSGPARLRFGRVQVDRSRRRVELEGQAVHLTPTEYKLLLVFLAHPGKVLTHQQIFDRVWGRRAGDAQQYLRVYVANLRKKLEEQAGVPQFFHTVPGVGYRFDPRIDRH